MPYLDDQHIDHPDVGHVAVFYKLLTQLVPALLHGHGNVVVHDCKGIKMFI